MAACVKAQHVTLLSQCIKMDRTCSVTLNNASDYQPNGLLSDYIG